MKPRVRSLAIVSAGGVAGIIALSGAAGASTANITHRPTHSAAAATKTPVTAFTQEFQTNLNGFCPKGSGNLPCDGAVGDYGPISRVLSGFSNGGIGNYAPGTRALPGQKFYAWTAGSQMNNLTGCPSTATEYCTGPYALFGQGTDNTFPADGFTITDDLYLSPKTAKAGNVADDDVGLNTNAGTYGVDNVVGVCKTGSALGFVSTESSPSNCADVTGKPVTKAGWYRFIFEFAQSGMAANHVVLTEKVYSETTKKVVWTTGQQDPTIGGAPIPVSSAGGPGYFWLPTENVYGLPLANFALQLGQHAEGQKP